MRNKKEARQSVSGANRVKSERRDVVDTCLSLLSVVSELDRGFGAKPTNMMHKNRYSSKQFQLVSGVMTDFGMLTRIDTPETVDRRSREAYRLTELGKKLDRYECWEDLLGTGPQYVPQMIKIAKSMQLKRSMLETCMVALTAIKNNYETFLAVPEGKTEKEKVEGTTYSKVCNETGSWCWTYDNVLHFLVENGYVGEIRLKYNYTISKTKRIFTLQDLGAQVLNPYQKSTKATAAVNR